MPSWAFKVLFFSNQKRCPYSFDNLVFHFMIPPASKVLCFYIQKGRRRKVGFHFTIPRASNVLCFYNQNSRHRKVGCFQRKRINLFSISKLKTSPLYDDGGFDCEIQYFGKRRNRKVGCALYATAGSHDKP